MVSDAERENAEVELLVRQAMRIGSNDAVALGHAGFAVAYILRDLAFAEELIRRALMLNSNLASAWVFSGVIHLWSGNPVEAVRTLSRARRLDPLNEWGMPEFWLGTAYFFLDRHEDALRIAESLLQRNPDGPAHLRLGIISAAFAGHMDIAQKLASRLKLLHPAFRVSRLEDYIGPYRPIEFREKYKQGLLKAGLPE